jgi:hypothetical protein
MRTVIGSELLLLLLLLLLQPKRLQLTYKYQAENACGLISDVLYCTILYIILQEE